MNCKTILTILVASSLAACAGVDEQQSGPADGTVAGDAAGVESGAEAGGEAGAAAGHHGAAGDGAAIDGAASDGAAAFDGPMLDDTAWTLYGAGVHLGDAIPVATILADPKAYDGKPVRVEGTMTSVCQNSGCWAKMGSDAADIRVTFDPYGTYLPMDGAGQRLVVEGTVTVKETSVNELRHYLEDAGKPEEAAMITQPRIEASLVCKGAAIPKQ